MPRSDSQRYYPLNKLLEQDRGKIPDGHTFAVKRGAVSYESEENTLLRLTVVNAEPAAYVLGRGTLVGKGVASAIVPVSAAQFTREATKRYPERAWPRDISVVRFAGSVILPNLDDIQVVGAFVPHERSTGYLHVVHAERSEELFQQREA